MLNVAVPFVARPTVARRTAIVLPVDLPVRVFVEVMGVWRVQRAFRMDAVEDAFVGFRIVQDCIVNRAEPGKLSVVVGAGAPPNDFVSKVRRAENGINGSGRTRSRRLCGILPARIRAIGRLFKEVGKSMGRMWTRMSVRVGVLGLAGGDADQYGSAQYVLAKPLNNRPLRVKRGPRIVLRRPPRR